MIRLSALAFTFILFSVAHAQSCLVAFYPFSGNAIDATGNGNDGLVVGPIPAVDRNGNAGQAYQFDGVDDFIDIGNNAMLGRASHDFSITAWVFFDTWSAVRATIITNRDGSTDITGSHIGVAGTNDPGPGYDVGELSITCTAPMILCSDISLMTLGIWRHVALTYDRDAQMVTFYYDGQAVDSGTMGNFLENPDVHHSLGTAVFEGAGVYPLHGRLDEVALFDCLLTPAEVLEVFNGSITTSMEEPAIAPLQGLYPDPATEEIFLPVNLAADGTMVQIVDMSGRSTAANLNDGRVHIGSLSGGVYLLRVQSQGQLYQGRFQKL